MRILYVGSFRLPHGDAAGARVLNVARSLRLAGHSVSFIAWGGEECLEDKGGDDIYRVDGFPYVVTNEIDFKGGVWRKAYSWLHQGRKTKRYLKEKLGQYDVIISYNCSIICWLNRFCKTNKLLLISDLTEWYANRELLVFGIPKYLWSMKIVQRAVPNKIVISSYLDNYYSNTHNIIIPATCDGAEEKWKQGGELARDIVGEFEGVTLIYAGTPAHKDAIHYAISAVQRLVEEGKRIRFIIVGITREQYLSKYKSLLSTPDLSENIQFVGRVSQEQVPSFYSLADYMVLLRESTRKSNAGFPTKFTESFISGTPVIGNITSDLDRYLIDGETGFIVPEPSEEAVYNTLNKKVMSLDKAEIAKLKENVREVAKRFDYHSYSETLHLFMNELK